MVVASGPAGAVLTGPVFDVSNSMTAHGRMINDKAQNYPSLLRCYVMKHMDYPNYKTSIIKKISRRSLHIGQPRIFLIITYTGPGEAKRTWSDHLTYKDVCQ